MTGVIGGPIDTYGVNVFVTCNGENNCKVNLYKHSAGGGTPPPPVPAPFDYSLSNNGNKTVTQGSSVNETITSTLVSGTTQSVSFSASGLPSGATTSFSSASCSPTCSSTMTISTAASTPSGTYTITVTATGAVNHTTSFSLTVNNASSGPPPSSLTFAAKCAQTGVLKCFDFDNVTQLNYGW